MFDYKIRPFTTKSEQGNTIRGIVVTPKEFSGKLPAIVMSHEFCANMWTTFRYARKVVNDGYACFCYDFTRSGSGISGGSSVGMSAVQESRDVVSVFNYAKSQSFVDTSNITLWGCSQGGMATSLVAPELEDQITKIILYYPALSICDDARKGSMITARFDPKNPPEKFWCAIVHVAKNYCTDVIDLDPYEQICKFSKPVLLIHGNKDHIVNVSYSREAAAKYPNCEFHEFPAEHLWIGGGAKKAVEITREFLAKNK